MCGCVAEEAGRSSVHFLDTYGVVRGFISNMAGMLGDGTNTERHYPVIALTPTGVENAEVLPEPAPLVASVDPGGSYLITGENFGADLGTVNVDGTALIVISWTDNSIHIENPLEPLTGTLVVTNTAMDTVTRTIVIADLLV